MNTKKEVHITMLSLTMQTTRLLRFGAVLVALSVPAFANPFVFTASGTAVSDGRAENAKATFTINGSSITVLLENTAGVGQLGGVSSTLAGVTFTTTGGAPGAFTLSNSTTIGGVIDCTAGTATCTTVAGTGNLGASPYGWGITGTTLAAGNGSGKPAAIVNSNVTGNTDGVSNGPHNDYLLGPVTFTLNFAGTAPTSIASAIFRFGTNSADTQTGSPCLRDCGGTTSSVPEPTSIAMLGGVVALVASKLKKSLV